MLALFLVIVAMPRTTDAALEQDPSDAAQHEEPPPPREETPAVDPLVKCRTLVDGDALEEAERCFRSFETHEDAQLSRRAMAMGNVVRAWTASRSVAPKVQIAQEPIVDDRIDDGLAEGVIAGSIAGGVAGFSAAAAVFAATRSSEADSFPWLVLAPTLGAVVGGGGSYLWIESAKPDPGDVSFTWSTTMMGFATGFNLQLAVFDTTSDVDAAPLRFLTILGGGALGLGVGAVLANPVDATRGDIAVAHSAAVWGGTLTALGIYQAALLGADISFAQGVLAGGAGLVIPYAATIAVHRFIEIEYWPSWMIDVGGGAGVLTALAAVVVLGGVGGVNGQSAPGIVAAGAAAGVGLGSVGAVMLSQRAAQEREGE